MTVADFDDPEAWWLDQFRDPATGVKALRTFFASQRWIHRRVERVSFSDGRAYLRRISLDTSVPSGCPQVTSPSGIVYSLLPVSLLRKVPLVDFSLETDHGASLFNLTLQQNAAVSFAGLLGIAEATVGAPLSHELIKDIKDLVEDDSTKAQSARDSIINPDPRAGDICQRRRLKDDGISEWFVRLLAENFLFLIPVEVPIGSRVVVKYSHAGWDDNDAETRDRWYLVVLERLGLRASRFLLNVASASTASSYHLQIDLPKGVSEESVRLLAKQKDTFSEVQVRRAPGRTPHLVCSRLPLAQSVRAELRLRPSPIHWIAQSTIAAVGCFAILALFWWRTSWALPTHITAGSSQAVVTALLLASSSLVATLLTRPGEHGLASRLVRWLRPVVVTILAMPFLASLLVALAFSQATIRLAMGVAAAYSAVGASLLCITFSMSLRCERVAKATTGES